MVILYTLNSSIKYHITYADGQFVNIWCVFTFAKRTFMLMAEDLTNDSYFIMREAEN